jgi:hypothetical protein
VFVWGYALELSFLPSSSICCSQHYGRKYILLKHASIVPQCAIAIENLFKEAGAPEGLYTNLMISEKKHPFG